MPPQHMMFAFIIHRRDPSPDNVDMVVGVCLAVMGLGGRMGI